MAENVATENGGDPGPPARRIGRPPKPRPVEPEPEPDIEPDPPPVFTIAPRPDPPESYLPPAGAAVFRVVTVARGVAEANVLLAQGWQLIMGEFLEEILARAPASGLPAPVVFRPYFLLGKREPPVRPAGATYRPPPARRQISTSETRFLAR